MNVRETLYGISPYEPPEKLMTHEEYRERMDTLGKGRNLTEADENFFCELEDLRNDLYDMIAYDTSEIAVKGKKYYVSADGDDSADGLTPETAWATLKKVTETELCEGDGVYFKRGDLWRGNVVLQNGVTYQAYGKGAKPKIYFSFDGKSEFSWIKTETENIWVSDKALDTTDVGVIVFDGGKEYAKKQRSKAALQNELDFYYSGRFASSEEEKNENKVYLYCSKGNPSEVFEEIELSRQGHTMQINNYGHDITIHNIDMRYGQDYFFSDFNKNIVMSYCMVSWMGGQYFGSNGNYWGYGGGGGCWRECTYMEFSHCFFTQHFDTSASPQFNGNCEIGPCIFKDFLYHDCLVEYTEYSVEYFNNQIETDKNYFDGFYIGYNIMRNGGKGFGDKKHASRYIKGWHATNPCYNTVFEHNVFDRALTLSLEFTSRAPGDTGITAPDRVNYELLPKLKNNIYIEPKNKQYADINQIIYPFNEAAQITLKKLGVEENPTFIYTPQK